jgi:hypothetical protein
MKRIISLVLLYFVLGPPIGAAFVTLSSLTYMLFTATELKEVAEYFLALPLILVLGVGFSYWFGGLQAAFVGLVAGVTDHFTGNKTIWVPIFASLLTWLYYIIFGVSRDNVNLRDTFLSGDAAFWLSIHMVSGIGVWILQRWWRKRQPV